MQQQATIISKNGSQLLCRVECGDACQGCAARKVCSNSEDKEGKTLTLISYNDSHRVGDTITVEVSVAMGLRAVLLAYIIPVFVIIVSLLVLQQLGFSELVSGLSAIGAMVLYFICVKVFSIGRSVSVSIVEDNLNN